MSKRLGNAVDPFATIEDHGSDPLRWYMITNSQPWDNLMKFVCELTKKYDIPTVVSMNPIMIDGTGMCGGCRLSVGGETKFACVDGPEFDGHKVDFDEAMARGAMYKDFERHAHEAACNLFKQEVQ